MKKLKERWNINSNIQIVAILTVFAINGSLSAWFAEPVLSIIGIYESTTSSFVYWTSRILLIFPIYQLTLPIIGFLLGQFKFFWNFEKKFLSRLGLGFLFKKKN